MKKKFNVFSLVFVLLLSTLLTACGSKKENEQTVVVGITNDLDSLDPHKAVAAGTREVLFNMFEGLVKPNSNGDLV